MRDLVLVGGGHSHIEVLRRFALEKPSAVDLSVVLESPVSIYSGMVPGVVSGRYARRDVEIDVAALARRAGARVLHARLAGVDARSRRLELEGEAPLSYDVASLNVGSAPAGLDVPGAAARALPVRPMWQFLDRVVRPQPVVRRIVVGGGGAGGVELAFALRGRAPASRISLVEAGPRLLPQAAQPLARRVQRRATARGIDVHCAQRVVRVEDGELVLGGGERLPFDQLLWTAGAQAVAALLRSDLPRDRRGFVAVGPTLQVEGHASLFAAGDCASLRGHPDLPRAGVYAVRQGPVLAFNLAAFLAGRPLRRYRPRRDFLTLVNFADGSAAGGKWGVAFEGRWVMRLKDRIDRRFVARYR